MSKKNNLSFNNLGYQISIFRLYNINHNTDYIIYKLKQTCPLVMNNARFYYRLDTRLRRNHKRLIGRNGALNGFILRRRARGITWNNMRWRLKPWGASDLWSLLVCTTPESKLYGLSNIVHTSDGAAGTTRYHI
jgi:hypothetical protein